MRRQRSKLPAEKPAKDLVQQLGRRRAQDSLEQVRTRATIHQLPDVLLVRVRQELPLRRPRRRRASQKTRHDPVERGGVPLVGVEHRLEERAAAGVLGEVPQLRFQRREHRVGERLELVVEPVPVRLADARVGKGSSLAGSALELTREAASLGDWGALAAAQDAEELARHRGHPGIVRAVHRLGDDPVGHGSQRRLQFAEELLGRRLANLRGDASEGVLGDARAEEALAQDVKVGRLLGDAGEEPHQVVVARGGQQLLDDAAATRIHAQRHLVPDRLLEGVARQDRPLLDLLGGLRVRLEQRLDLVEVGRGALVDGVTPAVDAEDADAAAVVPVELVAAVGRVGHGGARGTCAMRGVGGRARVRELPVARVSLVVRRREPSVARGQVRAADGNLARSPGKKAPDAPPTLEVPAVTRSF